MERLVFIFIILFSSCNLLKPNKTIKYIVPNEVDMQDLMCVCATDKKNYSVIRTAIDNDHYPLKLKNDTLSYCMLYGAQRVALYPILKNSQNYTQKKVFKKATNFKILFYPSLKVTFPENYKNFNDAIPTWFYRLTPKEGKDIIIAFNAYTLDEILISDADSKFVLNNWLWIPKDK